MSDHECAWCGADRPSENYLHVRWWSNRDGELFCSPYHRAASNRALRRLTAKETRHDLP